MNDTRNINLNLKVTLAERERMHRVASIMGTTLSNLIRFLVLNQDRIN